MRSKLRCRLSVAIAAVAAIGTTVIAAPATVSAADPVTVTLLSINDFHGRIDTSGDLTTKWATTIEQQRALDPDLLLLGAGDLIGASLFNSAVAQDQPTIDVLNELCLNASAVGNHEFDKGYADLTGRVIDGSAGHQPSQACATFAGTQEPGTNALWSYLGANVYDKGTTNPALPEYATYQVKGITIGVVGAVTEETPALVSPGGITQIDIGDPVEAVNRVAAQLTDGNPANGEADVVVAEFHEGAPDGTHTLAENEAASAAFDEIVNGLSSKVAVVFNGHTHQAYVYDAPLPAGDSPWSDPSLTTRPVLQTGSYADHVGKVTLTVDPDTGDVSAYTAANLNPAAAADTSFPRVAEVDRIVKAAKAHADQIGLQPIAEQTASITTAYTGGSFTGPGNTYVGSAGAGQPNSKTGRDDRASESTMGGLVANMLRDTLAPPEWGGAQIGVTNPGGLRDELFYNQTGTEGDGVITFAEANNVLPFVNNLWTTTLTGAQFKTMLEQQWQRDANNNVPSRPYLQLGLSDNVSYTFDDALPEGSRITSITIDGAPYDPAANYRIGTFSFLATGGDNFRIFTQGSNTKDSGLVDRDGWMDYLDAESPVAPDFARRSVKVTNAPTSVAIGGNVTFGLDKLNLTSIGAPANASVAVSIGGVAVGSVPVANGAASVSLGVPASVPSGAQTLTAVACPSGTRVDLSIEVTGTTSTTPQAVPAQTDCGLQATNPTVRMLDTRTDVEAQAAFAPGSTLRLDVAGKFGVDAHASAVVVNVTSVNVTADGWIRAFPCGSEPSGLSSNLNPVADRIVANLAIVPLDSTGAVCFQTLSTSDLVVDLQGWYPATSDYHAVPLTRIADTRIGQGIATHLAPGVTAELTVTGSNGVAATASAVAMNLTAVGSTRGGWVVSFPCGSPPPTLTSNLNAWVGHAIANAAVTAVGTDGKVCFQSNIDVDLVVDLAGWFPAGSSYHAFTPQRALDTRETGPQVTPGTIREVPIAGKFGVPAGATTVSVNVTAVNAESTAWVKVFACGTPEPATSNNNTSPDRIVATQALVAIGSSGSICIVTLRNMDVVVDVQGYL
ncbi:MAG: 5'-nucleotidase C-terminal domain-containing protein [Ilumatobacteraceae bacterium]